MFGPEHEPAAAKELGSLSEQKSGVDHHFLDLDCPLSAYENKEEKERMR